MMTPLVRLVHMVEDNHEPLHAHQGHLKRRSIMNATPNEIHMLQVAAYNLPDGSGRLNFHQLTPCQKKFCRYYVDGDSVMVAYLKAFNCSYPTAKARSRMILSNPSVYDRITNMRRGLVS